MRRTIFLFIASLLLIACAAPQDGVGAAIARATQYAAAGEQELAVAESVRAATAQMATSVAQQRIEATRAAAAATQTVRDAATATAVQATANAVATAQSRADRATATAEHLSIRSTAAAVAQVEAGAVATSAYLATLQAQEAEHTNMQLTAQAQYEAIQITRQHDAAVARRRWSTFLPWFVLLLFLALLIGISFIGLTYYRRETQPVTYAQLSNGSVPMVRDNGTWRTVVSASSMLPEPGDAPQLPAGNVRPNWEAFIQFNHPHLVPIGLDVNTRRPILIDPNENPHVFAAGTTGQGKTTSALIPYSTGMLGRGVFGLLLNGGGGDFLPFTNHPNSIVVPQLKDPAAPLGKNEIETAEFFNQVLAALLAERNRRDGVLMRHGRNSWHQLPASVGEAAEVAIAIDEFVEVVKQLQFLQGLSGTDIGDMGEVDTSYIANVDKKYINRLIASLWYHLKVLTSTARKYGIFFQLAATDPTSKVLGKEGKEVVDQMTRVVFSMENAAASRTILGEEKGGDWPRGSVGLPKGQFLIRVGGRIYHAAAFHPAPQDVQRFFSARDIPPARLPEKLEFMREHAQRSQRIIDQGQPVIDARSAVPMPQNNMATEEERNGRRLDGAINNMASLSAVARYLSGRDANDTGYKPAGHQIEAAKAALQWRLENKQCEKAARLLKRSIS